MPQVTIQNAGKVSINDTGKMTIGASTPPAAPTLSYIQFDTKNLQSLKDESGSSVNEDGALVQTWTSSTDGAVSLAADPGYLAMYQQSTSIGPGLLIPLRMTEVGAAPFHLPLINSTVFTVVTLPVYSNGLFRRLYSRAFSVRPPSLLFVEIIGNSGTMQIVDYNNSEASISSVSGPQVIGFQWIANDSPNVVCKIITATTGGVQTITPTPLDTGNIPSIDPLDYPVVVGCDDTMPPEDAENTVNAVYHEIRFYPQLLTDGDMATVYNTLKTSWGIV